MVKQVYHNHTKRYCLPPKAIKVNDVEYVKALEMIKKHVGHVDAIKPLEMIVDEIVAAETPEIVECDECGMKFKL